MKTEVKAMLIGAAAIMFAFIISVLHSNAPLVAFGIFGGIIFGAGLAGLALKEKQP